MKIVVASTNPVKVRAVAEGFGNMLSETNPDFEGVTAASGVADQPMSDEETHRGARNRVRNAMHDHPKADYWVGIEGGIETVGDSLITFAWISIRRADGRTGESRTVCLPLPPEIRRLIDEGLELGEANDQFFKTQNSKQAGGAFGLLTGGRYTRESVYTEAVTVALVPILNDLYRGA